MSSSPPSVKPRRPHSRPKPGRGRQVFRGLLAFRIPALILRSSASKFSHVFFKLFFFFLSLLCFENAKAAPWTKPQGCVRPLALPPPSLGTSHPALLSLLVPGPPLCPGLGWKVRSLHPQVQGRRRFPSSHRHRELSLPEPLWTPCLLNPLERVIPAVCIFYLFVNSCLTPQ